MKKFSLLAIAGLLALALPASAESTPTAPCADSAEYTRMGLSGAHEDVVPGATWAGPSDAWDGITGDHTFYPEGSVVRFKYRLDISGSAATPAARTADIRIALRWDHGVSDYDLIVYDANGERLANDGGGLLNLNNGDLLAGDTSGRETQFLPQVPHCTDLRIDVVNYLAFDSDGLVLDTMIGALE